MEVLWMQTQNGELYWHRSTAVQAQLNKPLGLASAEERTGEGGRRLPSRPLAHRLSRHKGRAAARTQSTENQLQRWSENRNRGCFGTWKQLSASGWGINPPQERKVLANSSAWVGWELNLHSIRADSGDTQAPACPRWRPVNSRETSTYHRQAIFESMYESDLEQRTSCALNSQCTKDQPWAALISFKFISTRRICLFSLAAVFRLNTGLGSAG